MLFKSARNEVKISMLQLYSYCNTSLTKYLQFLIVFKLITFYYKILALCTVDINLYFFPVL